MQRMYYYFWQHFWVNQSGNFPSEQPDKDLAKRYYRINKTAKPSNAVCGCEAGTVLVKQQRRLFWSNSRGDCFGQTAGEPVSSAAFFSQKSPSHREESERGWWKARIYRPVKAFMSDKFNSSILLLRQHALSKSVRWFTFRKVDEKLTQKILPD